MSLVSRSFHRLVTTPHAWRSAFSRFFPGREHLDHGSIDDDQLELNEKVLSERRHFARLSPLASWRSEYILRTRLLRSVVRGKPLEAASTGVPDPASPKAQVRYNSNLVSTVTHLHANYNVGSNKKSPRFIHGADELGTASASDPRLGKVDTWGFQDNSSFQQFTDLFPGDTPYGLGPGELVGLPNVMDVSQLFGMVYGEGHQEESVLWYRHIEEKRGRSLLWTSLPQELEYGIPSLASDHANCSVWVAKSMNVPEVSQGLVGILAGSSTGVLTAYSAGTNGLRDRRLERGQITARWVLSPGVPLIAIAVDEELSKQRLDAGRIWAVILNALGEAFCLETMPKRVQNDHTPESHHTSHRTPSSLERLAWTTGRTVHWQLIEPTRRTARVDLFEKAEIDGSYTPRSSWTGMHLNTKQLVAETLEIERFLQKKPKHFRQACYGWDMRRRLEVDFAGHDGRDAGEHLLIIATGLGEGTSVSMKRYTRCKVKDPTPRTSSFDIPSLSAASNRAEAERRSPSLFGVKRNENQSQPWSFKRITPDPVSPTSSFGEDCQELLIEEWRTSAFEFEPMRDQITCSTIDNSKYAVMNAFEDPLLTLSGSSNSSSLSSSPLGSMTTPSSPNNVPGCCARFVAVGTKMGAIFIYNIRAAISGNALIKNTVTPVRIIHTDSPQISCLAMTALYLVHGGNDGLVQAWDPLGSSLAPIRTLNSRFSSRARRRLIQAEASPAGVGVNLFAAGAISLDPDPTVLRGMVSLGSHLRYWSYSSATADQFKGGKRRLRRSQRGSNQNSDRFSGTGRGALKEYIANEKLELDRERKQKRKEDERLAGRFGLDLLGPDASEEELLAYATLLSQESAQSDDLERKKSTSSSDTITEETEEEVSSIGEEVDDELAEAIRLSLQHPSANPEASSSDVRIQHAKRKIPASPVPAKDDIDDELDYAIQLSMVTQERDSTSKGKSREV